MIRYFVIPILLALPVAGLVQTQDHDHAAHQHTDHDHASHDQSASSNDDSSTATGIVISRTPEIEAALAAGGEPVVVEVLGAVCDFCATAMNKTFGRRDEVSAVYVDLDAKTLNVVLAPGESMNDEQMNRLVVRSGYKAKAIHRGSQVLGESGATDPS